MGRRVLACSITCTPRVLAPYRRPVSKVFTILRLGYYTLATLLSRFFFFFFIPFNILY